MKLTEISPDQTVWWEGEFAKLNATIVFTWAVMALLVIFSWAATRRLTTGPKISRWQNLLEIVVTFIRDQIRDITRSDPGPYLPFIGTLFIFIAVSNALAIVPGYVPATASLSTAAALAICVFVAVPVFGVMQQGSRSYLKHYLEPSIFMLPFNVIGELSRTLALAVRLFGNVMSGAKIAAILLAIVPLLFPVVMSAFGLLTGLIQAYIFSILALVYIASGISADGNRPAAGEAAAVEGASGNDLTQEKG
jgi:F-type H+-transporting ATPase subunit a